MRIKTSKGKEFDIRVIFVMATNKNRVLIEMIDKRPLVDIIPDFDGLTAITKDMGRGVCEVYEGFTRLVGISRVKGEANTVRLTLERDDAND